MLNAVSNQVRHCLARAKEARRSAEATTDPREKGDYLRLEYSWQCVARSFNLVERLERFLRKELDTETDVWLSTTSIVPFTCDLELAIRDGNAVRVLPFPCRRVLNGWIDARNRRRLDVTPTHWRVWK